MKKLVIALMLLSIVQGTLATNYVKVINTTDQSIKVGLYKSLFNFTEMRVDPGSTREYFTGQEEGCLTKVTVNGAKVWSGKNCENYELTIAKQPDSPFTIIFKPADDNTPKQKPTTGPDIEINL